jgi:hypothetical protein
MAAHDDPALLFMPRAQPDRFFFPFFHKNAHRFHRRYVMPNITVLEGSRMDEDRLNMAVRKFLKVVGVSSQREIETAIVAAVKSGTIKSGAQLAVKMTLQIEAVHLTHVVQDVIDLA